MPLQPPPSIPVRLQTPAATIDGYLERATATDASIRSLGGLPEVGESGHLVIDGPPGGAHLRVVVSRVDASSGILDVAILEIDSGGATFLATGLLGSEGEDPDAPEPSR